MRKLVSLCFITYLSIGILASCNNPKESSAEATTTADSTAVVIAVKEETVTYTADTATMKSYIAYNDAVDKKRPVVLVIPEWWGLNDYTKGRAKQLASMGYFAIAVDMYGNGLIVDNPELAGKMAGPFYADPALAKIRFDAALAKVKSYPMADTNQVAAIGYCFGGGIVLNMAKLGEKLNGVVSFHGSLEGVPPNKNLMSSAILVCHGEADKFVPNEQVAHFRKQLDSINYPYTFKSYPNAMHAFTNPEATEIGKKFSIPVEYNAAADAASWNDMKDFFAKIFQP